MSEIHRGDVGKKNRLSINKADVKVVKTLRYGKAMSNITGRGDIRDDIIKQYVRNFERVKRRNLKSYGIELPYDIRYTGHEGALGPSHIDIIGKQREEILSRLRTSGTQTSSEQSSRSSGPSEGASTTSRTSDGGNSISELIPTDILTQFNNIQRYNAELRALKDAEDTEKWKVERKSSSEKTILEHLKEITKERVKVESDRAKEALEWQKVRLEERKFRQNRRKDLAEFLAKTIQGLGAATK
jgi:hypothetical protein